MGERNQKILSASRQVKEQYLKDLLQKMNDGEKITKAELDLISRLESDLVNESTTISSEFITDVAGIARFFNVTERAVQLWVKKSNCPKLSHGRYDLAQVHQWWLENIYGTTIDTIETEDVKKQYWVWKTENEKMKAQETSKELIPANKIYSMWSSRVIEVWSGLYDLSSRLPPLLEGQPAREMGNIIRSEVKKLHETFARKGRFCPKLQEVDQQN